MAVFVAQVRANPGADFYDKALADFAQQHFADAVANAGKAADQYHAQRQAAEKEAASVNERIRQARTQGAARADAGGQRRDGRRALRRRASSLTSRRSR